MTGPRSITRYPAGPITPVGASHAMTGDKPWLAYRSYNDAVVFNLMGPLSYYDTTMPESVRVLGLKGLIPPWENIEQKGATQDGSSYITSLYGDLEVDIDIEIRGRTPRRTRQVVRDWIDSWDAKKPGTLSWYTPEMGYWWANTRWGKSPVDKMLGGNFTRQRFTWTAQCSDAFWRSYDSTDVFAFSYLTAVDKFKRDTLGAENLGSDWTIAYSSEGSGFLYCDGTQATSTLGNGRAAVARRNGFTSVTDEQIVTATIGTIDPWPQATDVYLDLWARMANTGTPGQDGVRLRIGYRAKINTKTGRVSKYIPFLELSYFVGGTQTVLRTADVDVPWRPTDQISLAVGGYSGKLYSYYVQRGTNPKPGSTNVTWGTLAAVVHAGADGSHVGPAYRSAGYGVQSDGSHIPPSVAIWTAGDSSAAEESGYVTLHNIGDQDMWPFYILVGPGLFAIGDGPNATQAVTYGPLETNQMVFIRTDPRRYGVIDLTAMPPPGTPAPSQFLSALETAVAEYNSFLSNSNTPTPALSAFGVPFPQGNPYSLLNGRFSRPIPAKSPGRAAQPQQIAVAVESGGPTTAILAGGTPLRRYPA